MHYGPYQKYKAADNLFGQIPNEWRQERLHDVSEIRTSNVDKKSVDGQAAVKLCNYVDVYYNDKITSQIDFMPSTASDNEIERFTLYAGDVVFTKDSEDPFDIGIPTLITEDIDDLVCGYHLSIVKPDKNQLLGEYAYYALKSEMSKFQFTLASNGVTRFGLTYQGTKNIQLCIPSLQEQKQIAAFLDRKTAQIDRLIEKKKVLIEKLNEKRIALITHAVTKGLNPAAPMKPSGMDWLGDVPAHWDVRRLKFAASYNDESLSETTESDYELVYVDISSVDQIKGITKYESLTFEKAPSRARRIVKHGDTIVSTVRTYLKAIAPVRNPNENTIVSTGFAVIRPNGELNPDFLSYFALSQGFIDAVVANSKGVSYPAINATELVCMPIAFPPDESEQSVIVDFLKNQISHIDRMIDINFKTIERLTEYRTALITAAVTGKIDVSSIDIPDEEAA